MKSTLYLTATVLPGKKIEIETPSLSVGQTVEVVLLSSENSGIEAAERNLEQAISLEDRRAFLKRPIAERRKIMASQAETMVEHYEKNCEWQELMLGDIIDD